MKKSRRVKNGISLEVKKGEIKISFKFGMN